MHTITEIPWTPAAQPDGTLLCAWCGEQLCMHYQHADGRSVCVRFSEPQSAEHGDKHE